MANAKHKDIITITVQSDLMEVSRAFTSNRKSITWLRQVHKMHTVQRQTIAGKKPRRKASGKT